MCWNCNLEYIWCEIACSSKQWKTGLLLNKTVIIFAILFDATSSAEITHVTLRQRKYEKNYMRLEMVYLTLGLNG